MAGCENPARKTIRYCIDNDILRDYLKEAGDEVENFLIAEYDYETDIRVQGQ